MTKLTRVLTILILSSISSVQADNAPPIKGGSDGIYYQYIHQDFIYLVDTRAQLCFASIWMVSASPIDCQTLKNRSEWKAIIKWEK